MMRIIFLLVCWLVSPSTGICQEDSTPQTDLVDSVAERNKQIARDFYEDLWFSDRTDRFEQYVAEEYVLHDIGDLKNVVEPAIQQKEIPDFLRSQGDMGGEIDFQIAEGDLVVTRWHWQFKPKTWMFRLLGGRNEIPVINVFRFRDGKIVEIWNHRHDIDTGQANIKFVKGLLVGFLVAMALWMVTKVIGYIRKQPSPSS